MLQSLWASWAIPYMLCYLSASSVDPIFLHIIFTLVPHPLEWGSPRNQSSHWGRPCGPGASPRPLASGSWHHWRRVSWWQRRGRDERPCGDQCFHAYPLFQRGHPRLGNGGLQWTSVELHVVYSEISNSGPSEKWTPSPQWTNFMPPITLPIEMEHPRRGHLSTPDNRKLAIPQTTAACTK